MARGIRVLLCSEEKILDFYQNLFYYFKSLAKQDRKTIGEEIKLVQFRWPLGMPLVRKIETDLWEVRSNLSGGRIARVFFTVGGSEMALLHGFIKKSQKTSQKDLNVARNRIDLWQSGR
ncbi:MAG: type II toxin-antitoxin system RelE/ParE family toxin [bacterium]